MNPHKDSDLRGGADVHARLLEAIVSGSAEWKSLLEEHLYSARDRIKKDLFGDAADGHRAESSLAR